MYAWNIEKEVIHLFGVLYGRTIKDKPLVVKKSITRQVDKKSGVPKEDRRVWNSQGGGKDKHFFFFLSRFLSLSYIKHFFSLSPELMITQQTTQFKLCTKDYITPMYCA